MNEAADWRPSGDLLGKWRNCGKYETRMEVKGGLWRVTIRSFGEVAEVNRYAQIETAVTAFWTTVATLNALSKTEGLE